MNPTGLILAAGLSRRMGFPKALLEWQGETYLDRQIRLFRAVCAEVLVVLRPGVEAQLTACHRLGVARIAYNPDADRGQFSSLQSGLAATSADAILFCPIDYAHVAESTVQLLATPHPAMVLQPSYHGQHGHPVRILRPVTDALLSAPVTGAARDVIRRYERAFLEVDDPGVTLDADDPAAFAQVQERLA